MRTTAWKSTQRTKLPRTGYRRLYDSPEDWRARRVSESILANNTWLYYRAAIEMNNIDFAEYDDIAGAPETKPLTIISLPLSSAAFYASAKRRAAIAARKRLRER